MLLRVSEIGNNSCKQQHCYERCLSSWEVLLFRKTLAQGNGKHLQVPGRMVKWGTESYGLRKCQVQQP